MPAIAYRGRASGDYPLSLADVRLRSGVGFGSDPTQDVLDLANVDPVESAARVYDPATQRIAGEGVPVKVGAVWRQTWVIEALPAPTTPAEVTMRQARLSLSRAGILTAASQAIAAMPGVGGDEARIEWEFAATLRRDHPLVAGLGQVLSLNAKAIDNLFIAAAQIP